MSRSRSTTSRASASSTRRPPATPSTAGPPGSRRPPARSARASRPPSGWPLRRNGKAAHFNRPGFELFDFDTYVICGDGDLMEGVSHEAGSFAGHQRLDNLCWIYDSNRISIDGDTEITYEDDVARRFEAYGWNVTTVADANSFVEITRALDGFKATEDRPTLIIVDSHIGYGSPHKQDTAAAHGEPLGDEEVRETKRFYGWPEDAEFLVPDEVRERFAEGIGARGAEHSAAWQRSLVGYEREHESLERQIGAMQRRELPEGWDRDVPFVRGRRKGDRHPQGVEPGPERDRRQRPVAAQRLGRPDRLDLGPPRREAQRRRLPARQPGRPPASLRDPRARVGGDLERTLALEAAPVVVDVPDLLRLRAPRDPAVGADGDPGDPHLHARLDRPRRGRPDPPAGRAARLASRRPGAQRDPPLRRERGRRGVACDHGGRPPADRAGPDPPGRPGDRPHQVRGRRRPAPRRLRARRRRRRRSGADPGRDRARRSRSRSRRTRSWPPTGSARASSACRRSTSSTPRTRPTATRSCRRR